MRLGARMTTSLQGSSIFGGGWRRSTNSNSSRVRHATPTLPKLAAPASTSASGPALEPALATATEHYSIKVFTGDMRGAGTRAEVFATLIGDKGESDRHVLSSDEQIERNSAEVFDITHTGPPLGEIHRIRIGHDESNLGSGWLLERVEVQRKIGREAEPRCQGVGEPAASRWHFGCFRWLGRSDSGGVSGPAVRELLAVAGPAQESSFFAQSSSEDLEEPGRPSPFPLSHSLSDAPVPKPHYSLEQDLGARHAEHGLLHQFGRLRVFTGTACAPHPDKVRTQGARGSVSAAWCTAGEDALLVHRWHDGCNSNSDDNGAAGRGDQHGKHVTIAVADGVFEWSTMGVDAGAYARALLQAVAGACDSDRGGDGDGDGDGDGGDKTCSTATTLAKMTVAELRAELRHRGLKQSGRKVELIERLQAATAGANTSSEVGDLLPVSPSFPRKLMDAAWQHVCDRGLEGSCTALIADVHLRYGVLNIANLGDSGALLLRAVRGGGGDETPLAPRFRTPQQEHNFGCPYQLGHHDSASTPNDAQTFQLQLEPGDVIVIGTDGLFDNVHDERMAQLLDEVRREAAQRASSRGAHDDPHRMLRRKVAERQRVASDAARLLLKEAFHNSINSRFESPYATSYMAEFDLIKNGGKKDDIAIAVALVESAEDFISSTSGLSGPAAGDNA